MQSELPPQVSKVSINVPKVRSSQASSVSNGRNDNGLSDPSVFAHIVESIQYYTAKVRTYNKGRTSTVYHFLTDFGYITSSDLQEYGFIVRPMSSMVKIISGDTVYFIRSGDPNPDYYHPDEH
mgnify:CR=1 FL=1|jgi:hypothetical protein